MSRIPERRPQEVPAFDPNADRYWDPRDLEQELRRTFQICHECRMCVGYCGAFPILFDAVDRDVDAGRAEGVELLDDRTVRAVSDHCWQCKLCYIKCPYTEDEQASELLDFPRLMAREKAQRARRDGVALVDRILGEPQLIGKLSAGPGASAANLVNENRLVRKAMEKVTGIASEFPLPPIASQSFPAWLRNRPKAKNADAGELVLFSTCYGDYNFPEVARAATVVLEHNGFSVVRPDALTCCGMPNLDGGDVALARAKMQQNVDALLPLVRRGRSIVVPGPTCGYTIKKEWPHYLGTPEAKEVASATLDFMELLDQLRKDKVLETDFGTSLGKVVYHAACHLRAQKIAIPGARVLSRVPDTEVRIVEQCTAVDGTWGMKAAYYQEGVRYAQKLVRAIESEEADVVVGDCSLAGQRVLGETGQPMLHPAVALARAYGLGYD